MSLTPLSPRRCPALRQHLQLPPLQEGELQRGGAAARHRLCPADPGGVPQPQPLSSPGCSAPPGWPHGKMELGLSPGAAGLRGGRVGPDGAERLQPPQLCALCGPCTHRCCCCLGWGVKGWTEQALLRFVAPRRQNCPCCPPQPYNGTGCPQPLNCPLSLVTAPLSPLTVPPVPQLPTQPKNGSPAPELPLLPLSPITAPVDPSHVTVSPAPQLPRQPHNCLPSPTAATPAT